MSALDHSTDGFVPDMAPTEEPDEEYHKELLREHDRRKLDDYDVTHQHFNKAMVVIGCRDNTKVAIVAAKNPVRNER